MGVQHSLGCRLGVDRSDRGCADLHRGPFPPAELRDGVGASGILGVRRWVVLFVVRSGRGSQVAAVLVPRVVLCTLFCMVGAVAVLCHCGQRG